MTLEEVAENHGLTPEGVDYALRQYQIVINEITHGMLSKLSYDAKDVIRIAQERWCDTCDLKEQEECREMATDSKWSIYDFESEITELMDKACNELSPDDFDKLLDNIDMILADYRS